ncbi:MAG: pyrroloquinoline quinone precursor peptide PqqA [Acidobacteria bacterium]|nr:MAG: pyrroloquinoline quinone precursor peptide PqqA [Acidobacteriota bacterium]
MTSSIQRRGLNRPRRLGDVSTIKREVETTQEVFQMEWIQPDFEEISLGCEVTSYAVAEL